MDQNAKIKKQKLSRGCWPCKKEVVSIRLVRLSFGCSLDVYFYSDRFDSEFSSWPPLDRQVHWNFCWELPGAGHILEPLVGMHIVGHVIDVR